MGPQNMGSAYGYMHEVKCSDFIAIIQNLPAGQYRGMTFPRMGTRPLYRMFHVQAGSTKHPHNDEYQNWYWIKWKMSHLRLE